MASVIASSIDADPGTLMLLGILDRYRLLVRRGLRQLGARLGLTIR